MKCLGQGLALMNNKCLYIDCAAHLNFSGGISSLEVLSARKLASSLWGEERANGASDRRIRSGTGRGKAQNQKEGSGGDRGRFHGHPGYTDFSKIPKGRNEMAASHVLKISLLHFLLNHGG